MMILVLLTFFIIYFFPVIINKGFFWIDFLSQYSLSWEYKYERLRNFQLPLWDPYTFSGHPFLADHQNGVFYPLDIIGLLFYRSGDFAFNYWLFEMQVLVNILLGGIFMYILARSLKISKYGSLIASMIFIFGGFISSHAGQINLIYSAIWLPLVFLYFYKAISNFKIRYILFGGLFLGLAMLGLHVQTIFIIIFSLFIFTICHLFQYFKSSLKVWRGYIKNFIVVLFKMILIISIAFVIALPQLLPALQYYKLSNRIESNLFFAGTYSLNPLVFLITQFFPHIFGGFRNNFSYLGFYNYWEMTSYIGIISLILIAISVIFGYKKKIIRNFLLSLLIYILTAFGSYFVLFYIFYYFVPFFNSFRVPARFLLLFTFFAAIISGFGFDLFFIHIEKIKKFLKQNLNKVFIMILVLSFILFFYAYFLIVSRAQFFALNKPYQETFTYFKVFYRETILAFYIIIFFIYFLFKNIESFSKGSLKVGLVLILFLDLYLFGKNFNASNENPLNYHKNSEEIQFIQNKLNGELFRFSAVPIDKDDASNIKRSVSQNSPLLYHIYSIDGYQGMALKDYQDFVDANFINCCGSFKIINHLNLNRLSLLNTKYLILNKEINDQRLLKIKRLDDGLIIYENLKNLPHFFIAKDYQVISDKKEILSLIDGTNFNPYNYVYLGEKPGLEAQDIKNNDMIQGFQDLENKNYQDIKIESYKPEEIILKTSSNFDGFLFSSEIYYPAWQATIDGSPAKIYKADYTFRAIYLSKGVHNVRFYYRFNLFNVF